MFTLHMTALTVEMRGVHSVSGLESLRTHSRAQDMSPRCLVPLYPSLQCRAPLGGGAGWEVSPVLQRRLAHHRCHALSLESPCLHCLLRYRPVGRPSGVCPVQGFCFTCSCRSGGLAEDPTDCLILTFSSLVSPSSSLPHRKRPLFAGLPAVQLQREPERAEREGCADVPPNPRSLRGLDPFMALPEDRLPDPVPGGGSSGAQECDRLLRGLRAAGPLLCPA